MKRRAFLASLGMGVSTGLAGCFGGGGNSQETATAGGGGGGSTPTGTPLPDEAQLSLEQVDAPSQAEIQQDYTFTIQVSNNGGQPGVYKQPVKVRRASSVSYSQVAEALVYVEPGETQAAEVRVPPFQFTGSANVRVENPQNQWRIQVVGPRLTFGESFTTTASVDITVQRIDLLDSYIYNGPSGEQEIPAPGNSQYAFVYVRVDNSSTEPIFTPGTDRFRLLYQDQTLSSTLVNRQQNQYSERRLQAGSTISGWIAYQVPGSTTVDDLEVRYSSGSGNESQVAYWRQSRDSDSGGSSGGGGSDGSGSGSGSSTPTPTGTPQG